MRIEKVKTSFFHCGSMKHLYLFAIVILVLLWGCKAVVTGNVVKEPEPDVQKTLVEEENGHSVEAKEQPPAASSPEASEDACENQIAELQDELDQKRLRLMDVESNVTKTSLLLSYYKNAYGREDDYERQKKMLERVLEQRRRAQTEVKDRVSALKVMAKKCKIHVRFDRD